MVYAVKAFGFLLVPVVILGIMMFFIKPKKDKNVVCLPRFMALLGAIECTFFLVPTFICAYTDQPVLLPTLFLLISLLGVVLIVAYINSRITYDESGFCAKSFFGVKRHFSYGEVSAYKENMGEYFIYVGKKRVMVDKISLQSGDFLKRVKKEYSKSHGGAPIPEIKKSKLDIFKGNVKEPTSFLIVFIILGIALIAFFGFILYYAYLNPYSEKNTEASEVQFSSYEVGKSEIIMHSTDKELYKIRFIDPDIYEEKIAELVSSDTKVDVHSVKATPRGGDDFYCIKSMSAGITEIFSFEESNEAHRLEYGKLIILPIIMGAFYLFWVLGTIIVGRNPHRFKKWIVKLFFKNGYINYTNN